MHNRLAGWVPVPLADLPVGDAAFDRELSDGSPHHRHAPLPRLPARGPWRAMPRQGVLASQCAFVATMGQPQFERCRLLAQERLVPFPFLALVIIGRLSAGL